MAEHIVPHFHNDPGVPVIEIGAREFMCVGATPPHDHPHVFPRHGRGQGNYLPVLLDALSPRSGTRFAFGAPAGMRVAAFRRRLNLIG